MKRIVAFLIVFMTFSISTLAQQLTPSELDFVFDRSDHLELAYLSNTEMQQTKGSAIFVVIPPALISAGVGAGIGGLGYIGEYIIRGYNWSTSKFLSNTAMGAVTGSYFGWGARMAAGIGSAIWRINGFILNGGLNRIWRR